MTRFLYRALADLEGGGVNEQTERLFTYHHVTKHLYHSVRTNAHFLDWHNQPDPFRTYEGAPLITLPAEPGFPKAGTFVTMAELAEGARTTEKSKREYSEEVQLDVTWLSRLLWHSMAISAWKKVPADRLSLQPARESLIGKSPPHGNPSGAASGSRDSTTACITTARIGTRSSFAAVATGRSTSPVPSGFPGRRSRR